MKQHRPFIPVWFDELLLTPFEFRVYLHLWRRANRANVCWPSVQTIADASKLHRDTVEKAIKVLEKRMLIEKYKKHRNSNGYRMLFPRGDTRTDRVTDGAELPGQNTQQLPGQNGDQLPGSTGCQLPVQTTHQGVSGRITQRKPTIDGGKNGCGFVPWEWPELFSETLEVEYPEAKEIDPFLWERWHRDFNEDWKLWWKIRGQPTTDAFLTYIGKQLRELRKQEAPRSSAVREGQNWTERDDSPQGTLIETAQENTYTDERGSKYVRTTDGTYASENGRTFKAPRRVIGRSVPHPDDLERPAPNADPGPA